MREILTISLQNKTIAQVKKKVKKSGFESVSKYIKCLIERDLEDDWITEEELLEAVKEAEAEYKAGKTIRLKSAADLLK